MTDYAEPIERDSSGVAHIVALSGGKDSTALALQLASIGAKPYNYVCTPTGDELPELLRHWRWLEAQLGKPIIKIHAKRDLNGLIVEYSALPNYRMRWCTRLLKILPFQEFFNENSPCESYVGLRADEPERVGGIFGGDVIQHYPLREWGWGLSEVLECCREWGATIPRRTDCARCYHQRLSEWWELWKQYPDIFAEAEGQELATGHTFRSSHRDTWPASLKEMRERFELGEIPRGVQMSESLFTEYAGEVCRACSL